MLKEQFDFYNQKLSLQPVWDGEWAFEVPIGSSVLRFEQAEQGQKPYYHFAINIPYTKYQKALGWLKERVAILPWHGEELIDFSAWEAWAMYFADPAGNIVELIARERIPIPNTATEFGTHDLLHISEIGWGLSDLEATYTKMQEFCPIPRFDGSLKQFFAAGDDFGLFIMVNKHTKKWMPNDRPVIYFPFLLDFEQDGQMYHFQSWAG